MTEIAIVGMAGRFPDADSVTDLWLSLLNGHEAVRRLDDHELRAAGVPAEQMSDPAYLPYGTVLRAAEYFDAGFFHMTPAEARQTDPQHRLFMECAWRAMEDAGISPGGRTGVFASAGANDYFLRHVWPTVDPTAVDLPIAVRLGNEIDFLASRVCHIFDLKGPAVAAQTACSSSLVSVDLACTALATRRCDTALAGAVSLRLPNPAGYFYVEGGTYSRDGHCRPFDAAASGWVAGNGAAVIALKRLSDAIEDRDRVYAVIRGIGINNDGADKMSFAAPSTSAQIHVIKQAIADADIASTDVGYIETHGSGTKLGDPIEFDALTKAYEHQGGAAPGCALGGIKANIGHLGPAAGIAGLVKTALVLHHQVIPPQINYTEPNPLLKLDDAGFVIRDHVYRLDNPLRAAAVSAMGMGGTNVHLVLTAGPKVEAPRSAVAERPFRRERYWIEPIRKSAPVQNQVGARGGDLVERITAIFQSCLGVESIDVDDHFDDMGGSSITALSIVDSIADQLGPVLGLGTFIRLGTPRRIAEEIRTWPAGNLVDPVVVRLREGTPGEEVFFLYPASGTSFCYHKLALHTTFQKTVYAISYPFDGPNPPETLREMAVRCVDEIRAIAPRGPYRLAGYSLGGNLAIEATHLLELAGESVRDIVLIDALPLERYPRPFSAEDYVRSAPITLAYFLGLPLPTGTGHTVEEGLATLRQPTWSRRTEDTMRRFMQMVVKTGTALSFASKPPPVHADIALLAAEQRRNPVFDAIGITDLPDELWQEYTTGTFTTTTLPGNHYTLYSEQENFARLAAALDRLYKE